MATVGRFRAVVSLKGLRVGGLLGWLTWAVVHITFLTGFANRFTHDVSLGAHLPRSQPQPARLQRPLHEDAAVGATLMPAARQ